jgi:flagellar hook protein FlgE
MGFAQGVSGLNAAAGNLDVIGNNIANSGTVGFKSASAQFADVYAGSRIGLGTQVSSVLQSFSSGAVQSSSRALDVAIVNGSGFFRLVSPGGEVAYSRNGQFNMDKNGAIVNAAGLQLSGYAVGANGTVSGGSPSPIFLPTTAMPPQATGKVAAQFNIDSRSEPAQLVTPFDPNNSSTYHYANALTIFDSLGNSHELSTFFVKTTDNRWDVYATANGKPLDAGGAVAADGAAPVPLGTLVFNTTGQMVAPAGGQLRVDGLNFGNGSANLAFDVDLRGTTQFGNASDVKKLTQNGYTSGQLVSYAINQDGTISGKYSNEQTNVLAQVVLSSFLNPNGLKPMGDNVWAETSASGQPLTGAPGSGTSLGALQSGAVEASNVDLTSELVNLIIAQRTYQANAQTVKTQDQVMQTLVNMR